MQSDEETVVEEKKNSITDHHEQCRIWVVLNRLNGFEGFLHQSQESDVFIANNGRRVRL
jgi:hypothetical protein